MNQAIALLLPGRRRAMCARAWAWPSGVVALPIRRDPRLAAAQCRNARVIVKTR